MTGPNTRAGRTLLEAFFTEGGWPVDPEAVILAIEAEATSPPALEVPPETEAVRRCVTHHACECHARLAEIGRRYLDARLTAEQENRP